MRQLLNAASIGQLHTLVIDTRGNCFNWIGPTTVIHDSFTGDIVIRVGNYPIDYVQANGSRQLDFTNDRLAHTRHYKTLFDTANTKSLRLIGMAPFLAVACDVWAACQRKYMLSRQPPLFYSPGRRLKLLVDLVVNGLDNLVLARTIAPLFQSKAYLEESGAAVVNVRFYNDSEAYFVVPTHRTMVYEPTSLLQQDPCYRNSIDG